MLVIISGTDSLLIQAKIKEVTTSLAQGENISFLDNPTINLLQESALSQDLFGDTSLFVFRSMEEDVYDFLFEHIHLFSESKNSIIAVVDKVLKKQKDICAKNAVALFEIKSPAKREAPSFVLADAFLKRDKKATFLALHEELATKESEEIHRGLWYQVKNLCLILKGVSEEDSGLHPFVYKKIKSASKLFSQDEVGEMMKELVEMNHLAHRGQLDFPVALELFVLKNTNK